ncbi:CD209 antigen-like [Physella acuta]|uniref:CD209 antigen-like n=1 Tax=Physella acuta TaxID=109671 RepID=UPI0027DD63E1|nr:CD209 antigen-like [Physella acuta]
MNYQRVFVIVVLFLSTKESKASPCPSKDWFYFASSCYYLYMKAKTWHDAQEICSIIGSNLVILNSEKEIDFLNSRGITYVWIGLHRLTFNNPWTWVDMTALNIRRWDLDQPGNDGENCCLAHSFDKWHDYSCSREFKFLCEKSVSSLPVDKIPDVGIVTGATYSYTSATTNTTQVIHGTENGVGNKYIIIGLPVAVSSAIILSTIISFICYSRRVTKRRRSRRECGTQTDSTNKSEENYDTVNETIQRICKHIKEDQDNDPTHNYDLPIDYNSSIYQNI